VSESNNAHSDRFKLYYAYNYIGGIMIELHVTAKKVGNSWAVIIPKDKADQLDLSRNPKLHAEFKPIPKIQELRGTLKTKKSTEQIMHEIDEGWD